MKRYITILIMAVAFAINATAQMSDSQIIEFVQKEQKAGTSQAQIVTKLMQKGVTIEQIRRLRKMYEESNGNYTNAVNITGEKTDRSRKQNGTSTRGNKNNKNVNSENNSMYRLKDANHEYTYDEDDSEWMTMHRELSSFMPDSTQYWELETEKYLNDQKKKVFGRDIFNNRNLSFEPNMNIATPKNYVLGPGDAVFIDIYGATQKTIETTVSPDGFVTIEGYGPVNINGMTVAQANQKLRSTLGSRFSSSRIQLTVGQTRTIMVNVMGEVRTPGTYTLSAFATVFHALYMAGGTNDIGTLRNIKVYRNNKLVSTVDIYDYMLNGKLTGNVKLTDNDVIVVGTYDCMVNVTGKVKRPMYYEMKKTESLQSLLKYAGGFTGDAYTKSVRVVRKTGRDYSVFNVAEFDMSSFLISDEDSISVDSILPRYNNMVELKGAAFRPGMYQLGNDITSVRSLIDFADGLKEDAVSQHAIIHRMKADRTLEVISVDIKGILEGSVADIPLKNEDVLFIPSQEELQQNKTLTIHGEVAFPGIYKYAENETIEDLILQSGGLLETASTVKVDVSRRITDKEATHTDAEIAKTFTFKLKEGFVIDGQPGFTLQPFDEVYVHKSPGYNEQQNVEVDGEVLFRGVYTLSRKETRISDIIAAAGGVNALGYIDGARLERKMTQEERDRVEQSFNMSLMEQRYVDGSMKLDSVALATKMNIGDTYVVGLDLRKALDSPGCEEDIVLRDGDKITIPQYNNTVRINGEVMHTSTVAYEKGKNYKHYIREAGGYNTHAKKSNTYIVYANGKVSSASKGKIQPGCEIVVPTKERKNNPMQTTQQWVSIASVMATLGAVLISVLKK